MRPFPFLLPVLAAAALLISLLYMPSSAADSTLVIFDLPDTIECHDVTPDKFAAAHPALKVIEARFRVSARIEGSETSIVDFLYLIASPGLRLKIQDYLPNTMLESTMADDRIEVTVTTESSKTTNGEARVAYDKVVALGGSKNQTSKKTETNHYKEIVPKALVLASGTMNREHGVFFKLRPSKAASLEGAKEFTFLAAVPKTWRGDWCTMACAARAKKKSFFFLSTNVAGAGIEQAHVGLYLAGDLEASALAARLCAVQEANREILASQLAREGERLIEAMQAATRPDPSFANCDAWTHCMLKSRTSPSETERDPKVERKKLEEAKAAILDAQERLSRISGSGP